MKPASGGRFVPGTLTSVPEHKTVELGVEDEIRDDEDRHVELPTLWDTLRSLRQLWPSTYTSIKSISAYPSSASLYEWGEGSAQCSHTHTDKHCVIYQFKGLFRGLAVGYGLKTAFTLAIAIFSRKMFKRPLATLYKSLVNYDSLRFSLFLGAMGFAYRILQCLFTKVRGRPGLRNNALAAAIAGCAIMLDNPERRATIAGYLFIRALYEMCRTMVYYKRLQARQYAVEILFAICQIPIMYSFLREPYALSPSYHKWILRMSNLSAQSVRLTLGLGMPYAPCSSVYHEGPCISYNFRDFVHGVVFRALPIYVPVHIVPPLLFKTKHVMRHPGSFLRESLIAIVRSCLFLGSYTSIVKSTVCFFRWLWEENTSFAAGFGGLLTGLALLFEHPKRHVELLLYVAPRAIETTLNLYQNKFPRWFRTLRANGLGDTVIFCAAMAMFVYCADTRPRLKGINATIFRLIFGSGTQMLGKSPPPSPSLSPRLTPQNDDSIVEAQH